MYAFTPTAPLPLATPRGPAALCAARRAARPDPSPTPPRRTPPTMRRSRRGGRPPVADAFATCPACGSDEPVATTDLLRYGSAKARCSQCGESWTASAADALTDSGARLIDAQPSQRRQPQGALLARELELEQMQMQTQEQSHGHGVQTLPRKAVHDPNAGVRLYVAGLGARVDSDTLRRVMEAFGEVRDANVMFDRASGRSRGVGFVTVVGRAAAAAAIDALSGTTAFGRRLSVREAIP